MRGVWRGMAYQMILERAQYRDGFCARLPAFQTDRREPGAEHFPLPPVARPAALIEGGEAIVIDRGSDLRRRRSEERIAFEQRQNGLRAVEQFQDEAQRPRIIAISAERGEPHLPVEPGLKGLDPSRCAI